MQTHELTINKVIDQIMLAPKWRNLMFDKNGRNYRGITLFESRIKAEERMKLIFDECDQILSEGLEPCIKTSDGVLIQKEYAWHMQIPVTGAS